MQREETARSREESRLWRILPWIWLGIAWLSGIFLMACFGRTLLDSDMASEMVLASLLNREGGMVSANWYYSLSLIHISGAPLCVRGSKPAGHLRILQAPEPDDGRQAA